MGPVPWEAMKCCHGSLMGINDVFRPQDTLCEVGAEIVSLSQNKSNFIGLLANSDYNLSKF